MMAFVLSRRVCGGVFLAFALIALLHVPGQGRTAQAFEGGDPRSCLEAMTRSMEAHDAQAFDRLMDIEGIARALFAELERASNDDRLSQSLPPLVTLMASKGALTNPVTGGFLASEVREFVLYGVGSGAFAGEKAKEYQSSSMLAPLFSLVSMGRKEICAVGEPSRVDRDKMRVPFKVRDHDNGNTYPVRGVFAREGNGWKMIGIENLRELIVLIGAEAENDTV